MCFIQLCRTVRQLPSNLPCGVQGTESGEPAASLHFLQPYSPTRSPRQGLGLFSRGHQAAAPRGTAAIAGPASPGVGRGRRYSHWRCILAAHVRRDAPAGASSPAPATRAPASACLDTDRSQPPCRCINQHHVPRFPGRESPFAARRRGLPGCVCARDSAREGI